MEFGELEIYDFNLYRIYYGLANRAYILVKTPDKIIDLNSLKQYSQDKIQALLRVSSPTVHSIHDNLEVRVDKRRVQEIIEKYPDYSWALKDQLDKMSIYASNLRFYINPLLDKIDEILEDYTGTRYHSSREEKKHFVRRLISNFDKYIQLDELKLNWVNFLDCLSQISTKSRILVVNTWHSLLLIQNYRGSDYPKLYYRYSKDLLHEFLDHSDVKVVHLVDNNFDRLIDPNRFRIEVSSTQTANPIRYL